MDRGRTRSIFEHPAGPRLKELLSSKGRKYNTKGGTRRACVACGARGGKTLALSCDTIGSRLCRTCARHHETRDERHVSGEENHLRRRLTRVDLLALCRQRGIRIPRTGATRDWLADRLDDALDHSTIEELKQICVKLGIDGLKSRERRRCLLNRARAALRCREPKERLVENELHLDIGINDLRSHVAPVGLELNRCMSKRQVSDVLGADDPGASVPEVLQQPVGATRKTDQPRGCETQEIRQKIGPDEENASVARLDGADVALTPVAVPDNTSNVAGRVGVSVSSIRKCDLVRLLADHNIRFTRSDCKVDLLRKLVDFRNAARQSNQPADEVNMPGEGRRVSIFWDDEQHWFEGSIQYVDERHGLAYVAYDDGSEEWEGLGPGSRTRWVYPDGQRNSGGDVSNKMERDISGEDKATPPAVENGEHGLPRRPSMSPLSALIYSEGLPALSLDDVPSFGAEIPSPSPPVLLPHPRHVMCTEADPPPTSPIPCNGMESLRAQGDQSNPRPSGKDSMTIRSGIIQVLRDAGVAMSLSDISNTILRRGLLVTTSKDPSSLASSPICKEVKKPGGKIVRVKKGVYGLREWYRDDGCLEDGAFTATGSPGDCPPTVDRTTPTPQVSIADHGCCFNSLEDYGDLPTWSNKAIRGAAASLLLQTPTAQEIAGHESWETEENFDSGDDDLFGEVQRWAMNLPDVQSEAPENDSSRRDQIAAHVSTCPLDLDVSSEEVVDRINQVCHFLEDCVGNDQLPSIMLTSGTAARPAFTLDSAAAVVRFSQMVIALDIIHENLVEYSDSRITQRDLYYIARSRDATIKAPQMMQMIQDVSVMLNVPRFAMGIDCRSKGLVFGPIQLPDGSNCMDQRGTSISGSVVEILAIPSVNLQNVSCIIIVEKESVFQRLIKEAPLHPIFSTCVILTGCGYPDIGTRAFLHKLRRQDDSIPVVGLADWNPHGAHILCQYRYGSGRSLESQAFCAPSLGWLGIRSTTLERLVRNGPQTSCFSECTSRDLSLAKNMRRRLQEYKNDAWMSEIECMEYGLKADIECVYSMIEAGTRGFVDMLGELIEKRDWI